MMTHHGDAAWPRPSFVFLLLAAVLGCSPTEPAATSPSKPDEEGRVEAKFSANAEKEDKSRRSRILKEIRSLPDHAWAGEYYQGDGLGVNQSVVLSPESGFVFNWHGCLGLYDRNYGAVRKTGNRIALAFELPNQRKGFQGIAGELIPIRWGDRRYLIPTDAIAEFCNAVNTGEEPRENAQGFFLLRNEDWQKMVEGKPSLPEECRAWLLDAPIAGKVTAVGEGRKHVGQAGTVFRTTIVTLSLGKADGVFLGMRFYFGDGSGNSAKVITAEERQSAAEVLEILSDGTQEYPPNLGAPVSSKPGRR